MSADGSGAAVGGPAALATHRFSWKMLDGLASGAVDEPTMTRLCAVERSYRYVLLRAVLDAARGGGHAVGPLVGVDVAWDLLVATEDVDPATVGAVLGQPHVGAWAARVLRRMRGVEHDDVPLWVDLGYLHTIAAAAAIRAGATFTLTVPVRYGEVILPTLGAATLPRRGIWEWADVVATGRSVRIVGLLGTVAWDDRAAGAVGWRAAKRLTVGAGDGILSVELDDTDPGRFLQGSTRPTRLGPAAVDRWESHLGRAWALLVECDPRQAKALAAGTSSIVPMPAAGRLRTRSASSGDAFGSVVLSEPDDPEQLAVMLIHEFQHAQLGVLMHMADLFEDDGAAVFYAPWRDDPRPLGGFLQGIFAFFGVTGFWRRRRRLATAGKASLASFEFCLWRGQVRSAVAELARRPELTAFGRRFLGGVATTLEGWRNEPVSPAVNALAAVAAIDHRARWRAHHLCPPRRAVEELASAWAGRADARPGPPAPSRLRVDPAARDLDALAVLSRLWLEDRDGFRALDRAGTVGRRLAGATPADLALIAGRHDSARAGYVAALAADPRLPGAWTGLGHVLVATGDAVAGAVLLDRPELVARVARAVLTRSGQLPSPVGLARWLGEPLPAETPGVVPEPGSGIVDEPS